MIVKLVIAFNSINDFRREKKLDPLFDGKLRFQANCMLCCKLPSVICIVKAPIKTVHNGLYSDSFHCRKLCDQLKKV